MKKLFLTLFSIIMLSIAVSGQELDATVIINYEQLPVASRERLDNFKNQVQDYLNNNKFTRQNWEGDRIKCTFNIFFTGTSDEVSYSAQLVVVSQRPIYDTKLNSLMLNILDNSWTFRYEKNQAMYFNQTDFDPLTSFLDFYALIIIGFDLDSFYKLGGSDLFSKALDITVKGGSSRYADGWQLKSTLYNRRSFVENLLNAKYQQLRMDFFDYHYNGLDIYQNPKTKVEAQKNIVKLINNLAKVKDQIDQRSSFLKVFFDAKSGEICDYLKDYSDKTIFEVLKKIDTSHIAKYDEVIKTQ